MDREVWWATVHGVTESQTRMSDLAAAAGLETLANNFKLPETSVPVIPSDSGLQGL